jgi:hypothetical protein
MGMGTRRPGIQAVSDGSPVVALMNALLFSGFLYNKKETAMSPATRLQNIHGKQNAFNVEIASRYIDAWSKKSKELRENPSLGAIPPTICLSRKIGVGVRDIAERLGKIVSILWIEFKRSKRKTSAGRSKAKRVLQNCLWKKANPTR